VLRRPASHLIRIGRHRRSSMVAALGLIAAVISSGCTESSSTLTTTSPDSAGKCGLTVTAAPLMGSDGGNATISVTTTPECAWAASTTTSWISGLSPASGQGNGNVSFQVAVNDGTAPRDGEIAINDSRVRVSQRAPCVFTVTPENRPIGEAGGPGAVTIATAAECAWTASSDVSWISLTPPVAGSGNGTVNYTVAANTGPVRTGNVTVAGQRSVVTQDGVVSSPCSYSISRTSENLTAAGGPGTPIAVSTQSACAWSASSNAPWISITSGSSGTGNGSVTFAAAVNTAGQRTGTLTIAGSTFTVTQAAAAGCLFTLSASGQNVGAPGGPGTVGVTTTAGCAWTASANVSWISLTSGLSGTGSGSVGFNVATNTGASRTGTLTIASQTFTITQAAAGGASCTYVIAPSSQNVPATASTGTVVVTSGSGCTWNASSGASWIAITSGATGDGNGSVGFSVAANPGAARTGTLTIAGQPFTVMQDAVPATCTYVLSATTLSVPASAGTGSAGVTAGSSCPWTATSNVSWIGITSGASGSGNGSVSFTIAANTGALRAGTLTIAGQTFTVTQAAAGPSCTYLVSPPGPQTLDGNAQTSTFGVSAGVGCLWTAVSNASWITVTAGASGSGDGSVTFSVSQNDGPQRTGTLTIAGTTATVVQRSRP
jgi:Putative binding domain, N-terminal/Viral BACON domain